jgi:hypothetical protein
MDLRALKVRAEDHGCNTCGTRGSVFYIVDFHILPARLVRKRHKQQEQTAIYCRSCYENVAELPYLVDGREFQLSKRGLGWTELVGEAGEPPPALECTLCGSPFGHRRLYGVISTTLFMHDSIIEDTPLALFCETCVETHHVSLIAKLDK